MRRLLTTVAMAGLCLFLGRLQAGEPIKAVVVTGGHGFDHDPFLKVFQGYDDIQFVEAAQRDHSEIFEDISQWPYDVIVLYNMTQNISEKRRENFLKLLDKGVGLVALHHSLGAFPGWPEYAKIIGGRFYLRETVEEGVKHPTSTYRHGVQIKVQIADKKHPITRDLADFEIHDETYGKYSVDPQNRVLLTTEEPSSEKAIGWVRTYRKAPVCYVELGHDAAAYANEGYRRLVAQAIRWAAGRLPEN